MSQENTSINLSSHFLIAMPGLTDDLFAHSVVYLCEHSDKGALGLIINKPSGIELPLLFERVDLPFERHDLQTSEVLVGGPLQTERGFVLHEPLAPDMESPYSSTLRVGPNLDMTTSRDVLEAMSVGAGPKRALFTLGYSSWAQGQLETELAENAWLTVQADAQVLFDMPAAQRYDAALGLLGLKPGVLMPSAGHA